MSDTLRRARNAIYWTIGLLGGTAVFVTVRDAYGTGGIFPAVFMLVISGVLTIAICLALGAIVHFATRALHFATVILPNRTIGWEGKMFRIGQRVVINRDDPDPYENPMVIRPEDSPHSKEIDCDNGKTGVVIGGNNFGSLAVRWDAQEWSEHSTRRRISLPSFEDSIHPEHMDLASSITLDHPLKAMKSKQSAPASGVDLKNKDWLKDIATKTPMRDLADLPHEVLVNDYFIGLLGNASIAAIGSDHHRLPREVIRKIAIQICRRAEHDSALAQFLELCKTAEPRWRFDWQKAAAS